MRSAAAGRRCRTTARPGSSARSPSVRAARADGPASGVSSPVGSCRVGPSWRVAFDGISYTRYHHQYDTRRSKADRSVTERRHDPVFPGFAQIAERRRALGRGAGGPARRAGPVPDRGRGAHGYVAVGGGPPGVRRGRRSALDPGALRGRAGAASGLAARRPMTMDPWGHGGPPGSAGLAGDLFGRRIVLLHGALDESKAGELSIALMTLDAGGDDPVTLQVDPRRGTLDGALAVIDTSNCWGSRSTRCASGRAEGPALGVLAVCDQRHASKNARFRLVAPHERFEGNAREAEDWLQVRRDRLDRFVARISEATGQPGERIDGGYPSRPVLRRRGGASIRPARRSHRPPGRRRGAVASQASGSRMTTGISRSVRSS